MINTLAQTLPEPGTRIGSWEVVRQVGRGGMAVVFAVRDEEGKPGALKLVHSRGAREEVAARFDREYRSLSRMAHPNIVRVLDAGTWNERAWFVMELVEGRDLKAEVEAWEAEPPADRWARVRQILADVARALVAVHALGIVHRDLTPGNLMIRPDGSAVLMDFGVAKESVAPQAQSESELTSHGELLGTVAWMSPEQIVGHGVDARADLYSLGALCFLMLTGRRPFHARTLAGYLDKHLHRPVRPPREINPKIPVELEEICLRCLQKEPVARFASAQHLLLALGAEPPVASLSGWPARLVGRLAELGALSAAVAACAEGSGAVVVVEAPAGNGTSASLRAVADMARAAGLTVHHLAAGSAPGALEEFRGLVEALVAERGETPPVLAALLGAFGDGVVLERGAVFTAVRAQLQGTRPRVIVFDDVHELDGSSLELLEFLVRSTRGSAPEPILYLLGRTTGADGAAGLTAGTSTGVRPAVVQLGPLTLPDVEELVGSLVGVSPSSVVLAQRLHREGEGSPAAAVEVLRAMVEEGSIVGEGAARRLVPSAQQLSEEALPIPKSAREAVLSRLWGVPRAAVELVQALALARQELSLEALAMVVGASEAELTEHVSGLVEADLVRERGVEGAVQLEVAHARVRDVLLLELGDAERQDLHRRLGLAFERLGRGRLHLVVDSLAHHFEAARMPGKAFSYLLRSGVRLFERSFVREALRAFDRAVALEPEARLLVPLDEADRLLADLLLRRAEALEHTGDWGRHDADTAQAAELARLLGDERLSARTESALGRRARQMGDLDASETHLRAALAHADRAGDASLRSLVLNQLGSVQWARGDLDGARRHWVEGLAVAEGARDQRSLGYGYNGLGMVAACRGQAAESRRNFEQAAAIFESLGLVVPLTWVRYNLIEVHVYTGNLRRGLELAERALAHAREMDHTSGVVLARAAFADVLTHLGRAGEARSEGEGALALARELGDPSEIFTAMVPLMRALWALGAVEPLAPLVSEALALAEEYDHEGWACIVHAWKARLEALAGNAPGARAAIALALVSRGPRWPYQEVRLDLALSRVYALLGDRAEAARRADSAIRRADACGYRLYVLKGHMVAATWSSDDADVVRHSRVADALGRALAANLAAPDAERFLAADWLRS